MKDNVIAISENRLKHMLQVGRTAEALARELFDWPEKKYRDMFLLGYLHDFGYEYAAIQSEHPIIAGEMLKETGYKYWREVYWHGTPNAPYSSDELLLLNLADNLTDGYGNLVMLRDRLEDIGNRYGQDSPQAQIAVQLAKEVSTELKAKSLSCPLLESNWWAIGS